MTQRTLSVSRLTLNFDGTPVLKDVSFSCDEGSLTAVTGANGSGKTSLLNVLSGLVLPSAGDIRIGECDCRSHWTPQKSHRLGVRRTFQIPRNWESLDLLENLTIAGATPDAARAELDVALTGIGLRRSPTELSFGQRRLLEVLRIRLSRGTCTVLLLDEPLAGLDAVNAARVQRIVASVRADGAAVLVTEHHPERWADVSHTLALSPSNG